MPSSTRLELYGITNMNNVEQDFTDRKYFVMVPRIVLAMCEGPHEYILWSVIKDIAGDDRECYLSTEDLATLSMMSTGSVSKYRKSLVEKGLLRGEIRRDPGYPQPVWHLQIPDLWPRNVDWSMKHKKIKERIAHKKSLHLVKPSAGEGGTPTDETKNIEKKIKEDDEQFAELVKLYNQIQLITPLIADHITDALQDYGYMWVKSALERTIENHGTSWRYVARVLENMKKNGPNWKPPTTYQKKDKERMTSGQDKERITEDPEAAAIRRAAIAERFAT